ncbi:MAG TPA: hypothetical protein DCZ23_00620 [Lachnospiraceae bacterium]|nr:hypothetical protein [Lachnospiraceae bacterium]
MKKNRFISIKKVIYAVLFFVTVLCVLYCVQWKEDMQCRIGIRMQLEKQDAGEYAHTLLDEMEYFPVCPDNTGKAECYFEDGYGTGRTYGGERKHEGIDIMSSVNKPGCLAIRSVSDGIVEKKGWLELGGYRLGIRSRSGVYYYYAHLDHYEDGIKEGTHVHAGEIIGYMGNTGYGPEGTKGQFDVHLHFGIYISRADGETSLNPYYLLEYLSERGKAWRHGFGERC